jgi:AraC family transcriptional regulator of adaptative response / DNA-3-methyladenine glycosylase II
VELEEAICEQARLARDPRYDGRFFIGVTSTGIYCRPICPSPHARREHVRFFPSAAAAQDAGFRPCLRCRPEVAPGSSVWRGPSEIVRNALRLISEGALDTGDVEGLAARVGVSARHLSRLFQQHLGARPIAVAQARRLHFAKQLITDTQLPMSQVALASGYGSLRRFNAALLEAYHRSPTELRNFGRTGRPRREPDEYVFHLAYRPPYDWDSLLAFLEARATPGVESVKDGWYHRSIRLGAQNGFLSVAPKPDLHMLEVRIRFPDPSQLMEIISRVRTMFDLAADPEIITRHLSRDPLLEPFVRQFPGLRVPGAWEGFEMTVRAILGQQVSVRGATTLAGRLAERFGQPLPSSGIAGVDRCFPDAGELAEADIRGLPDSRRWAIRSLARAVVAHRIVFDAALTGGSLPACFQNINGIGEWTTQYVAMRVLNDPNAFPAGDRVLRRAAGQGVLLTERALAERARAWIPWRAYAAMYLWRGTTAGREGAENRPSVRPQVPVPPTQLPESGFPLCRP